MQLLPITLTLLVDAINQLERVYVYFGYVDIIRNLFEHEKISYFTFSTIVLSVFMPLVLLVSVRNFVSNFLLEVHLTELPKHYTAEKFVWLNQFCGFQSVSLSKYVLKQSNNALNFFKKISISVLRITDLLRK